MRLIINEQEFNELIKLRVLKPNTNNNEVYELETKNNKIVYVQLERNENTNIVIKQLVEPSMNTGIALNTSNSLTVNSKQSDEEIYKLYRDAFPTDINLEIGYGKGGISLRTGNKAKIISKLKQLIDSGITIQEIVAAVKLDISDKKQATLNRKDGENQLIYMKRMESWINQTATIESLIDRLKNTNNTNTTTFKTNSKMK